MGLGKGLDDQEQKEAAMHPRLRCSTRVAVWLFLTMAVATPPPPLAAFTPDSPEVKEAVNKGIKFLETEAARDDRLGAMALRGLALLKHGAAAEHPKIAAAVAQIRQAQTNEDPAKSDLDIYSTGLSIVFLVELDPSKYKSEITWLMKYLQWRQKPHGAWGYPGRETGDTSMTQYGVLSAWEAAQVNMPMPVESVEGVTTWLLRTQDPSGGFGYQGTLAEGAALVPQSEVRESMTAAGLGSLCICATMLGIGPKAERRDDNLPPALKEVKSKEDDARRQKIATRIDAGRVREAQSRGIRWMQANYKIDPGGWTHYYLYALERCMSFLELVERKQNKEPKWYNDGVEFLIRTQTVEGSWSSQAGVVPDTAFSVLFLLRSTRKSIEKAYSFGHGTLIGGRGLPKETDLVEVRAGQIVASPLLGPAEGLLAALDDPKNKDRDAALQLLAELPAPDTELLLAKHGEKIRELVNHKSPEARLAAVIALGKTRDLDHVPLLIYALTDPDAEIVRAAHESLLRIARNPTAVGFPEELNDTERHRLIDDWKAWYRAIRPAADMDF
jgi:hypothetical protein